MPEAEHPKRQVPVLGNIERDERRWTLGRDYTTGGVRAYEGPAMKAGDEVEVVPASQLRGAVEALRALEAWAARMPDAGLKSGDPRLAWYWERPPRYGGQ